MTPPHESEPTDEIVGRRSGSAPFESFAELVMSSVGCSIEWLGGLLIHDRAPVESMPPAAKLPVGMCADGRTFEIGDAFVPGLHRSGTSGG
jgi:hypothetical protein